MKKFENTWIGKRLKDERNLKGLTQLDLSKLVGKSASMLSHYERGECVIQAGTLAEIADRLGFSLDEFFYLKKTKSLDLDEVTLRIAHTVSKWDLDGRIRCMKLITAHDNQMRSEKDLELEFKVRYGINPPKGLVKEEG